MANDLPPGYTLDPPKGGADLPAGYTLDEPPGPVSGGAYAAKELAPGQEAQGERRRKLMELLAAKGEPGYGARLADNFTFGLNRPLGGVASVLGGGSWKAGVGAEEDYIKRAEANTNPYLGAATDIVGGIASGGPAPAVVRGAATVAKEAPSKLAKVAQWLAGSTGTGAIEGAARNAEDVGSAAIGAGVGGAVSKVGSSVVGALTDRLASKAAKEITDASRGGSASTLAEEGGKIYDKLDKAGISFKDTPRLAQEMADTAKAKAFNPVIHDELAPVLKQIEGLKDKPATWAELQNIRTQLSDAKASDDKRVRRMAGELGNVLDNFEKTAKPTIPARSVGIDVAGESKEARDLWHRGSKAATAEFAEKKGMATTRDPARKLETNFGAELDRINNPKKYSPFQGDPEQKALIEKIAQGSPRLSNAAGLTDKASNALLLGGGLGAAGGLTALGTLNDPYGVSAGASSLGLAATGAGLLGKKGAGTIRKMVAERGAARVDDLIRNIVTGSTEKAATQNVPREALARVLAVEQLKRGAGRYSSNWYDKE